MIVLAVVTLWVMSLAVVHWLGLVRGYEIGHEIGHDTGWEAAGGPTLEPLEDDADPAFDAEVEQLLAKLEAAAPPG